MSTSRDYLTEKQNSVRTAANRIQFLIERMNKDKEELVALREKTTRDNETIGKIEALLKQKDEIDKQVVFFRQSFANLDKDSLDSLMEKVASSQKDKEEIDAQIRVVFYARG